MKKTIVIAVFIFALSAVSAQLNVGVKFGSNLPLSVKNFKSQSSGYNLTKLRSDFSKGYQFGVFARIGELVYFQPELLYEMGKIEYNVTLKDAFASDIRYDELVTISTIDIPLLVGYNIYEHDFVNVRAFAGPKLRLDAGSKLNYKNLEPNSSITANDIIGEVKRAKVGFETGVGVDFFMFTFDARLNLIGDTYKTKIKSENVDNASNSTFVISLGWKLL